MGETLSHLLSIDDLSVDTIQHLLQTAQQFVDQGDHLKANLQTLKEKTIATLFFEDSTRTHISFLLAAERLGATVVDFKMERSSLKKGESILDTAMTLQAMGCDIFIVRHSDDQFAKQLAAEVGENLSIVNAGSGRTSHPTQALLDLLTITQYKPDLTSLSVAIVGDILHSRVARSQITLLQKMGVSDIRLVGPEALLPQNEFQKVTLTTKLDEGIKDADVVIALRIQKERMAEMTDLPDTKHYFQEYGLTKTRLQLAKPDAIIMHPGPMNRGIEIEDAVADGPQSVILKQISNGVAIRMAVLTML